MYKCVIGVTSGREGGCIRVNEKYLRAIEEAGGYPITIGYEGDIEYSLNIVDGLLFTGGGDFCSDVLGEAVDSRARGIDGIRDKKEIELLKRAYEINMPILGICRGAQLMNIALGGSIIQHIDGHIQRRPRDIAGHNVNIIKDSWLYEIARRSTIEVNSFHHQCIREVADTLTPAAYSEENYIEAVESKGKGYLLGIQWHPEWLNDYVSKCIFQGLISRAIDFNACKNV